LKESSFKFAGSCVIDMADSVLHEKQRIEQERLGRKFLLFIKCSIVVLIFLMPLTFFINDYAIITHLFTVTSAIMLFGMIVFLVMAARL
jgi:hypothetical protein